MAGNYWTRVLNRRLTRRRGLAAAGGLTAAAAFLAACGGDGGEKQETSSLLAKREDTSKQAKPGGTLIMTNPADPPHFDPHLLTLPAAAATSLIYTKLMQVKPGVLEVSDGTIEGDMAESWEFSPDKLTLTMKIRADAGTPPNQAPLNGRKLDASDVAYSWQRFAATGSGRQDLVNAANPAAPVLSLTATDDRTIVVKLKEPVASILAGFSSQLQGLYFIVPKEAESAVDLRRNPMGAGAYYLSEYTPSSRLVYTRNPNSYDKLSYPEKIETPIITENAQVIAQLTAGNIYTHYTPVPPESVMQIKRDAPLIGLYQTDINNVGVSIFFGFKVGDKAPFKDVRLRQAFSMAMDRDLYLDTWANVSRFKADGLEVETKWNSAARPSDYKGWFLDPQSKDFGENAKFYEHNIAEAKKLMAAAGYTGQTLDSNEAAGTNYGLTYAPQIESIHGMAAEAGFKFNRLQHQAPAPWNSEWRDSRGFFDGIAFRLTPVPAEPGDGLYALYNKNGSLNYGFDPEGKGVPSKDGPFLGDPTCDDLTQKIRTEFDNAKRIQYAHELQRYLGKMQYFHHALGSATGFNVAWPVVRNFSVFNGLQWGYLWKRYWIDDTQPPLKRA
ncbi:MAG TPA: ABC transporter substrate-binding protein [Dehalococcoidia bacterium]|nr:ABC transporter substrate-binding protein [Dehalococcoidia bacterium]